MRRTVLTRTLPGLALLALLPAFVNAFDDKSPPPRANYRLAAKFSKANVDARSYSTGIQPNWIGKSDEFWYAYRTSKGTMYYRVDPAKKTKKALFDRARVAEQLAELSRRPVDAETMQLTRGQLSGDAARFTFVFAEMQYEYDLKNDKLVSKGKAPAQGGFPNQGGGGGKGFGKRKAFDQEDADEEGQDVEKTKEEKDKEEKDKEDKSKEAPKKGGRTFSVPAPDGKATLFTKDYDVYLGVQGKEKEAVRLTKGGTEDYAFTLFAGGGFGGGGGGGAFSRTGSPQRTSAWSKDSKHFYVRRQDKRNVKELFVINSLSNPRPTLEKYLYSMPGEDAIQKGELHVGTRDGKSIRQVPPKWRDEMYLAVHWGKEPGELRFLRMDRLRRNVELCAMDVEAGTCRVLLSDGFENAPVEHDPSLQPGRMPTYLDASDELLWWTERSGWGHWVLYDRQGKKKNNITSGAWRAGEIVAIDEKTRTLYVRGSAHEKGENVYYEHLYSVKMDGTGLTLLDPGDAYHFSYLSPSRKFVVDNSSRIDECPYTVLRDEKGEKVMDLETTDLTRLKEYGWKPPETFTVKAADGITELYGNIWKPFDFDPKKKYPIIAHVYPGPQTEGVTHTFATYNTNMQLAQLGFIVIQVGHRGGSPLRSKAYASYGYFNLRDYGLEDKKYAIEQLAAKYPWIDVKKVGIYGHSGGGFMSAAALLQKPYNEFFKAAVASAGNHDNNIYNNYWSEKYHGLKEIQLKEESKDKTKGPNESREPLAMEEGTRSTRVQREPLAWEQEPAAPPVKQEAKKDDKTTPKKEPAAPPPKTKFEIKVPTNAELAANLKGRMLLVHGEADNNVHPANTMRLVDALIKANKRFDMLILPATRHGFGIYAPYFQRRMQEFFAEHLLGDRRSGADMDERTDE